MSVEEVVFEKKTIEELAYGGRGAIKIGPFGSQLKKEEMRASGVKVYGQENIILSDWAAGERRVSASKAALLASCRLEAGDVVLTMMGTIGRCAIFPADAEPGIMDSHLLRIQPDTSAVDRHFLAKVIADPGVVGRQVDRLSHGSIMAGLSSKIVRRLRLPVPPLPEQRRIAEILDTLDEAIRKTEQVIAKLQQMKQGLLHDLLTRGIDEHGELRDPERHPEQFKDSPLGRIPSGWEVVQAGEHVNFNGGFGFPHVFQGRHAGELPFYKVSDQSLPGNERWLYGANNYVSRSLASRQGWRPAPAEGVAFAKVGAALLLNRRRILTRDSLVDNNMMVAVAEPDVAPTWLYWWLTTVDFGVFVQPGALPSVNQGQLNRLEVALPGLAEQTEIGRRLNAASVREVEEEKGLDKLRTLKHGLMDDLLTGRVRVAVPSEAAP